MNKTRGIIPVILMVLLLLFITACNNLPGAAEPESKAPVQAQPPATVNAVAPTPVVIEVERNVGDLSTIGNLAVNRGMTEVGRECVDCHKTENPGIINDWKDSRHAHASVTCIDCH
ncbi:MAG: hypothetical protein AB8I58_23245 [Anaerolineales bacterium]